MLLTNQITAAEFDARTLEAVDAINTKGTQPATVHVVSREMDADIIAVDESLMRLDRAGTLYHDDVEVGNLYEFHLTADGALATVTALGIGHGFCALVEHHGQRHTVDGERTRKGVAAKRQAHDDKMADQFAAIEAQSNGDVTAASACEVSKFNWAVVEDASDNLVTVWRGTIPGIEVVSIYIVTQCVTAADGSRIATHPNDPCNFQDTDGHDDPICCVYRNRSAAVGSATAQRKYLTSPAYSIGSEELLICSGDAPLASAKPAEWSRAYVTPDDLKVTHPTAEWKRRDANGVERYIVNPKTEDPQTPPPPDAVGYDSPALALDACWRRMGLNAPAPTNLDDDEREALRVFHGWGTLKYDSRGRLQGHEYNRASDDSPGWFDVTQKAVDYWRKQS